MAESTTAESSRAVLVEPAKACSANNWKFATAVRAALTGGWSTRYWLVNCAALCSARADSTTPKAPPATATVMRMVPRAIRER